MDHTLTIGTPAKAIPHNQIYASELLALLDHDISQIKVLSLDCFDTLLWRNTSTPTDVFFDLYQQPTFKALGFNAKLRAQAEERARLKMYLDFGSTEVKLKDIYLAAFPDLSLEKLDKLVEEELATETTALYAFPPMLDFIRKAHAKGMKIVIVSDTYFDHAHLKRLLTKKIPTDVMSLITNIFCSCEYYKTKSSGLFNTVISELNESEKTIMHIGDNFIADFMKPQAMGIKSLHFLQQHNKMNERLRMQTLAAAMIDPSIRYERSLASPYRGIFASTHSQIEKPESAIGYFSLGPIMYAFSRFICDDIKQMQAQGKNPKIVFLMRDGYLPSLATATLAGKEIGKRVRISRFASFAASFRTKQDVDLYLSENVFSLRFLDVCRQLLLPEKTAQELNQLAIKEENPAIAFIKLVHQQHILDIVFEKSAEYRKRLIKHIQNEISLEKGDTLVFVDLGYTGTSQLKLAPVFKEELGVDIVGRYLISLRIPDWESSRRGLIDPSWCDDRAMQSLVAYIALLEQLCTSNEKSVVDYDKMGNPIYSDSSVSKAQHSKLELIQAESLRFIRDADAFYKQANITVSNAVLRDAALAELTRVLFIPTAIEIDYLKSFEFDLNLGTNDILEVFDEEKGLSGLRKRGLFFMEKNLSSMRTNYPAELRSAGLELSLTLLAQHRFGFDIRVVDLSLRREAINVIAIKNSKASQNIVEAMPTHDGYFSLIIPVGNGDYQIGVQLGLKYHWLQIESMDLIVANTLYGPKESENTISAIDNISYDEINIHNKKLLECKNNTSLLIFSPIQSLGDTNYVLRIVFRPVVIRD